MRVAIHCLASSMLPCLAFGQTCPNDCSDRGECLEGVCACVDGWSGAACDEFVGVRVFMAAEGSQFEPATADGTMLVMDAGTTARVSVWIEDHGTESTYCFYQLILDWYATAQAGATGTLEYVDDGALGGGSVVVDAQRPDWIFAEELVAPLFYNETNDGDMIGDPDGFGMISTLTSLTQNITFNGTRYLGEFDVSASADATGQHVLRFRLPGMAPAGGSSVCGCGFIACRPVHEYQPLNIVIAGCGDGVCAPGEVCPADCACVTADDCCDVDGNGIRDDSCVWCDCVDGQCHILETDSPGDIGGEFGECEPTGFQNIHDAHHVLHCFAGTTSCPTINIDAGGTFGNCTPDGYCSIHDYVIALIAFDAICVCGAPAPEVAPDPVGAARLTLRARQKTVGRGQAIAVDVFAESPDVPVLGCQLETIVSGGRGGHLTLEDITVEPRSDDLFADGGEFMATNLGRGAVLRGSDSALAAAAGYVATLHYRASRTAQGRFAIDLRTSGAGQVTALVADGLGHIEVESVAPAVVTVRPTPR